MARKNVTEETVPGNNLDTIPAEPRVKKAKTVVEAAEVYAKAKRADKAEAELQRITSKNLKLAEIVEGRQLGQRPQAQIVKKLARRRQQLRTARHFAIPFSGLPCWAGQVTLATYFGALGGPSSLS